MRQLLCDTNYDTKTPLIRHVFVCESFVRVGDEKDGEREEVTSE